MNLLTQQYDLIKDSRQVVLDFCNTFTTEQLTQGHGYFSGRSIHDLLVHVADVYLYWLGNFALGKPLNIHDPNTIQSFGEITNLYEHADSTVLDFLQYFEDNRAKQVENVPAGRKNPITVTPLQLFTHVTTHEFHHKGQIVSMGRQLGQVPPDADVIRF